MSRMDALLTESTASAPVDVDRLSSASTTSGKVTPSPLSRDQLCKRLLVSSPRLVKELYDIAQRQIAEENGRQTRLDAKATSLLTAAGLSLTVAFTFGGLLVLGHHKQGADHLEFPWWAVVAFGAAVLAGLAAAAAAMYALLVRGGYRVIEENAIFDEDLLKGAEDLYRPEAESGVAESDEAAVTEYRKAIIPHLWEIAQTHLSVHQFKATVIRLGQACFLVFVFAIFVVCVSVVLLMVS